MRPRVFRFAGLWLSVVLASSLSGCVYPLPSRSEADAIERQVRSRLESVLESVTVTPMRFEGVKDDGGSDIVGFKVVCQLRDCPTTASNFTMGACPSLKKGCCRPKAG